MRSDEFKNVIQVDMTASDLNCNDVYNPRDRGKDKKRLRKIARKRIKKELMKEKENEIS